MNNVVGWARFFGRRGGAEDHDDDDDDNGKMVQSCPLPSTGEKGETRALPEP